MDKETLETLKRMVREALCQKGRVFDIVPETPEDGAEIGFIAAYVILSQKIKKLEEENAKLKREIEARYD